MTPQGSKTTQKGSFLQSKWSPSTGFGWFGAQMGLYRPKTGVLAHILYWDTGLTEGWVRGGGPVLQSSWCPSTGLGLCTRGCEHWCTTPAAGVVHRGWSRGYGCTGPIDGRYMLYLPSIGPVTPSPVKVTNTCPASILAHSLTLRDMGRKKLSTSSLSKHT